MRRSAPGPCKTHGFSCVTAASTALQGDSVSAVESSADESRAFEVAVATAPLRALANAGVVAVACGLVAPYAPKAWVAAWAAGFTLWLSSATLLWLRAHGAFSAFHRRFYVGGMMFNGLLWGTGTAYFAPRCPPTVAQLLLTTVGVTMIAMIPTAVYPPLLLAYSAGAMLPLLVGLFRADTPVAPQSALLLLVFGVLALATGRAFGRWVRSAHALADENARMLAEVRRAPAASEDERARLVAAIERISEGFVLWDERGALLLCNDVFRAQLGARAGLVAPGVTLDALFPREDAARWVREYRARREHDAPFEVATDDGRWLRIREQRTRDGCVVGVHEDVTALRRLDAERRVADRMLGLGTLAAVVGHEANNPLSYVVANLEVLREARLDEPLRRLVEESAEGVARVRGILRDLRLFSLDGERATSAVNLRALLDSCITIAAAELGNDVTVVRDYASAPSITGNGRRLGQALLNVLLNAMHAVRDLPRERRRVTVSARAEGNEVRVDIEDSGAGVSPELWERVFDLAFTSRRDAGGSGIGLAVARRVAEEHGGAITVVPAEGAGARFRLRLPAGTTEPPHAPPRSDPPAPAGQSVLIIDDEVLVGRSVARLLKGYDTLVTERAADALAAVAAGRSFAVVLCDVMMPEMSGIEFVEALRRASPALVPRVVMMTGGTYTVAAAAWLASSALPCLEKPLDATELRRVVARVARGRDVSDRHRPSVSAPG
jgi:signal transduction histidine kinase/CheY-like chemotaxis protein